MEKPHKPREMIFGTWPRRLVLALLVDVVLLSNTLNLPSLLYGIQHEPAGTSPEAWLRRYFFGVVGSFSRTRCPGLRHYCFFMSWRCVKRCIDPRRRCCCQAAHVLCRLLPRELRRDEQVVVKQHTYLPRGLAPVCHTPFRSIASRQICSSFVCESSSCFVPA